MVAPEKSATISEDFESAKPKDENSSRLRLPGIDLIRISLTWLILLAHTCLAYSGSNSYYVNARQPESEVLLAMLDAFGGFGDLWLMSMFFFLSGLSAYHALFRRSEMEFRKERVHRLLVPWLLLVLTNGLYSCAFFAPPGNPDEPFLSFLMLLYIAPNAGQGWFLLHLFLYSQVTFITIKGKSSLKASF